MRLPFLLLALGLMAAPANAASSSTATTRLVAIVPVACSIEALSGTISEHRLTLTVRRTCNTAHVITLGAQAEQPLGRATLYYNHTPITMHDGYSSLAQPERYYNGVDTIVIEAHEATPQQLEHYARSMNVGIEIA